MDNVNLNPVKDTILGFFGNIKNLIKEINYRSFSNSVKNASNRVINATREIIKESVSSVFDEDRKINGTLLKDLYPNCTYANWIDDGVIILNQSIQIDEKVEINLLKLPSRYVMKKIFVTKIVTRMEMIA